MNCVIHAPSPIHIAIICFGLEAKQLHKQPWHSVHGIALGLQQNGFLISIITDAAAPPTDRLCIVKVSQIYHQNHPSPQLVAAIATLKPDRIIAVAGTQELLRSWRFHFGVPVSLLFAHQRFQWKELQRLRLTEWVREWRMVRMPLIQSLLPAHTLRSGLLKSGAAHLLFLSDAAQKRHTDCGLPPGTVVTPRISPEFITAQPTYNANSEPVFCYFGSPLFLRGVKDVINAFVDLCAQGSNTRLMLLIRVDDHYTTERSEDIVCHLETCAGPYRSRITYRDDKLSPQALSAALQSADVYVLPFKITVSDVPLVVIEAAMSGKPVVTLDTPGISEWRSALPNIITCSPATLTHTMKIASAKPPIAIDNPTQWTDWQAALSPLSAAILQPLDCSALNHYRMICLVGIDGSGKSTLLAKLSEQLGLQGYAHGYIWSRFRNYLSKPFLGLMRLTGHNRKIEVNGTRIGLHDFASSAWLSHIFLLLQKCDIWLDIKLRYKPRLKHGKILGDRCPLDTLVDLAVDTGLDDFIYGDFGKKILSRLPQPSLLVMVVRNQEDAHRDRPDIAADPHYQRRVSLYKRLAATFDIPILHNDGTLEEGLQRLCQIAKESAHAELITQR